MKIIVTFEGKDFEFLMTLGLFFCLWWFFNDDAFAWCVNVSLFWIFFYGSTWLNHPAAWLNLFPDSLSRSF